MTETRTSEVESSDLQHRAPRAIWLIGDSRYGPDLELLRSHARIAIGCEKVGDLTGAKDWKQIEEHVRALQPCSDCRLLEAELEALETICFGIEVGDAIVLHDPFIQAFYVGVVTSGYRFEAIGPLHHGREVEWIRSFEQERLSFLALRAMHQRKHIDELPWTLWPEIARCIWGGRGIAAALPSS